MELAAKYAYEVYQNKSFSLAAKALFISQPALSAMVAKLERELGFQLFNRTRGSAVTLTPEGQIYMDMLEEIHNSEEIMKKRLEQYSHPPAERLFIGAMMQAAQFLIPEAVRLFHQCYPHVSIDLNLGNVGPHGVLHDKLENGMLELLLSYRAEERFESMPLLTERYIVVIRRDLPEAARLLPYSLTREQILSRQYTEEQTLSDLSLLDSVPFITVGDTSRSTLSGHLGSHYSLSPISVSDSRNPGMHYSLLKEGMGALLITDVSLCNPMLDSEKLLYIVPKSAKPFRTLYVLWRKGKHLSEHAKHMISFLKYASHENFKNQIQ